MYRSLIPNILTSLNLVFGMCSMISTYHGNYTMGSLFILCALVADGLDGRSARFFGVSSEIGKEMDSLCDLGSFGIAPAFLAYTYCLKEFGYFGWCVAIIFALCVAWRLARFNVNAAVVHGYFVGLAAPAGGCLVATAIYFFRSLGIDPANLEPSFPLVMLVIAYLMVSTVHYPDFKGKGEKIYLVSKLLALVVFIGILFIGREAILAALLYAIFATNTIFGLFNHSLAYLMRRSA